MSPVGTRFTDVRQPTVETRVSFVTLSLYIRFGNDCQVALFLAAVALTFILTKTVSVHVHIVYFVTIHVHVELVFIILAFVLVRVVLFFLFVLFILVVFFIFVVLIVLLHSFLIVVVVVLGDRETICLNALFR